MDGAREFAQLYRQYWVVVRDAASAMLGSREDGEDAAQRVFERLLRTGGWRHVTELRSFMESAGRNEAKNLLRDLQRRHNLFRKAVAAADVDVPRLPDDELIAAERREIVAEALETLPPRCRRACVLVFLRGFTHAQAADAMNISRGAVEKYVAHGRILIKRYLLSRRGGVSTLEDGGGWAFVVSELRRGVSRASRSEEEPCPQGWPRLWCWCC